MRQVVQTKVVQTKAKIERNPVEKALRTLTWLIQSPATDVGVRELAAALRLPPSNAHRLLSTLAAEGFLHRDGTTARYALGPELLRWAHLIMARFPLRRVALHHMRALVEQCGETAFLGVYDPARREMMFAEAVESSHPLRYAISLNKWMPMNTGASSLAILAFLAEPEIDAVAERIARAGPLTRNSLRGSARLKAELAAVRRRGYAFSAGQRLAGAIGLAAPIFGAGGEVAGDIVLTIPEQRFERRDTEKFGQLLIRHCENVSREIGGAQGSSPSIRRRELRTHASN